MAKMPSVLDAIEIFWFVWHHVVVSSAIAVIMPFHCRVLIVNIGVTHNATVHAGKLFLYFFPLWHMLLEHIVL